MSAAIDAFTALKNAMESYALLSEETWASLVALCTFRELQKHQVLYPLGETPSSFAFVARGLFRSFITDEKGNEYNKNFFYENTFPGSMVALLLKREDLKLFQIYYLEKNWLLAKDAREIAIVQAAAVPELPEMDLAAATTAADIEMWTATASAAFGYQIDAEVFHALADEPDVKMFLLKNRGRQQQRHWFITLVR